MGSSESQYASDFAGTEDAYYASDPTDYQRRLDAYIKERRKEEWRWKEEQERKEREEKEELERFIRERREEERREEERRERERRERERRERERREEEQRRREQEMEQQARRRRDLQMRELIAPSRQPQRPFYQSQVNSYEAPRGWLPDTIERGTTMSLTHSNRTARHIVTELDMTYMVAICEFPTLFPAWFRSHFDPQGQISQRANEIRALIRSNRPVSFKGVLSQYPPMTNYNDFVNMDIPGRAHLIAERMLPSQNGTTTWTARDFDGTGIYLEITMTDDSILKLYLPHLIAVCENPREFINWLRNGRFNMDDASFGFIKRSKDIIFDMAHGIPISIEGKLGRRVEILNCADDLKSCGINITDLATQEINALL